MRALVAENFEAGVRNASEALSLHLESMAEDGEAFPEPGRFADFAVRTDQPDGAIWALITVEAPDAADRVNVYLPRSLLGRVDRYVADHSPMNRSTFFGEAVRTYLEEKYAAAMNRFTWGQDRRHLRNVDARSIAKSGRSSGGELTLHRVLELAGLRHPHDFEEQSYHEPNDGRFRPDVTVRMPGGGMFVVDATCSLTAFMEAQCATDAEARETSLMLHAYSVKAHMGLLSSKTYWEQFTATSLDFLPKGSPEFVAMFLPGDSFLSTALDRLPDLTSEAMEHRVLPVIPSTLFALCKTLAQYHKLPKSAPKSETGRVTEKPLVPKS